MNTIQDNTNHVVGSRIKDSDLNVKNQHTKSQKWNARQIVKAGTLVLGLTILAATARHAALQYFFEKEVKNCQEVLPDRTDCREIVQQMREEGKTGQSLDQTRLAYIDLAKKIDETFREKHSMDIFRCERRLLTPIDCNPIVKDIYNQLKQGKTSIEANSFYHSLQLGQKLDMICAKQPDFFDCRDRHAIMYEAYQKRNGVTHDSIPVKTK